MADFQYRGRGGFRSGRINKRSNRGRPYGMSHEQNPGQPSHNSRLRFDDDVQMNGQGSEQQRRFDPVGGRCRRNYRQDQRRNRPQFPSGEGGHILQRLGLPVPSLSQSGPGGDSDWFKVLIIKGKNFGRDFIISSIQSLASVRFDPINFHLEGLHAAFFVKGKRVAFSIADTSGRITLPDGSKMTVKTQRLPGRPQTVMTPEVVEKLKLCMNKRYDTATCALNMSNLFNDDDMKKDELYLDLNHPSVAEHVIAIIAEYIPELKSMNLSDNRLVGLKQFTTLPLKAPHLSSLVLAVNRLRSDRDLLCIDKLPLEELSLDDNPLCNNFGDKQTYVSAIRKLFPKVIRLDGHVLPPPITFDADAPTTLPTSQGSYFMNEQYKNIICRFINWYFLIYDSDNRQPLVEAYHPEVMFSLSTFNSRQQNRSTNTNWNDYRNDRNLKSVRDSNRRQSHLKRGHMETIAALSKLPASQHSPDSFTVDVNLATNMMLTFTIHGVFRERESKANTKPVRKFSRTFVTIPNTNELGLVVINEMFSVTSVLPEDGEKYFSAAASSSAPTVASAPVAGAVGGLTEVQMQMVQQFSVQSTMNQAWSTRCLVENNWNYDQAAKVFLEVHAKQGIPADAFIQS